MTSEYTDGTKATRMGCFGTETVFFLWYMMYREHLPVFGGQGVTPLQGQGENAQKEQIIIECGRLHIYNVDGRRSRPSR